MRRSVARPLGVTAAAAAVSLTLLGAGGPAAAGEEGEPDPGRFRAVGLAPSAQLDTVSSDLDKLVAASPRGRSGLVSVIVKLDDQPAVSYDGHVKGYPATSARATGKPFNPSSTASRRYVAHLKQEQAAFERAAKAKAPSSKVVGRYDLVFGGVSVLVKPDEVAALAGTAGVTAVLPDRVEQPQTDVSPAFIGAGALWQKPWRAVEGR